MSPRARQDGRVSTAFPPEPWDLTSDLLLTVLRVPPAVVPGLPDAVPAGIRPNGSGSAPSVRADVREALAGLGYSAEEIRAATADLPDGDASELLRAALARLAAGAQR